MSAIHLPKLPTNVATAVHVVVVLTEAALAFGLFLLTGIWLYVHALDFVRVWAVFVVVLPPYGIGFWLIARARVSRETAERADDTADQALAAVGDLRAHLEQADVPATGRHAARKVAR